MYFNTKYAEPGKGWKKYDSRLIAKGDSTSPGTFKVSTSSSWKLELNPQGAGFTNCRASGKIVTSENLK
ncbi:hypothetical protein [Clostridium sp. D53t1_180928_C8]|uniref:hypothetical protein n=1 Tax=Clostridium sp. D53t1_180928_C8 TaxID=2787101 RepID=UPI0018AB88B8|nr:hypothetical protein [Clostridium sp. D53t1_180928_C8]